MPDCRIWRQPGILCSFLSSVSGLRSRRRTFISASATAVRRTVSSGSRIPAASISGFTARVAWIAGIRTVFRGICFTNPVREQSREGCADGVGLSRNFREACRKRAELYRNNDFLFRAYAQGDDQVSADFSVRTDAEISAAVICREAGRTGSIVL